ncbi:MAG TPA: CidA/LrgA family protein [Acetobacteraceae bacterium]|nr:CidA/LrgA family protein [Acetobacteraceae bacterium]
MVQALSLLLICQLLGTVIARASGVPIPGPVFGLILLMILLIIRRGPDPGLSTTAQALLRHLGLLFVPAGVGIVNELDVLRTNALALAVALPISTLLALVVTGFGMQFLLRGER